MNSLNYAGLNFKSSYKRKQLHNYIDTYTCVYLPERNT